VDDVTFTTVAWSKFTAIYLTLLAKTLAEFLNYFNIFSTVLAANM